MAVHLAVRKQPIPPTPATDIRRVSVERTGDGYGVWIEKHPQPSQSRRGVLELPEVERQEFPDQGSALAFIQASFGGPEPDVDA